MNRISGAERTALALAECLTRIGDHTDPVPDDIGRDAASHFSEPALAHLSIQIGLINIYNRVNVAVTQNAGERKG